MRKILPEFGLGGIAHAPRDERSFADVSESHGAGDHVAVDSAFHRDLQHLAIVEYGPCGRDLRVFITALEGVLAVLVSDVAGELRAGLVQSHDDHALTERRGELDAPFARG